MKPYLKEFGEKFYSEVKRLIDEAVIKGEKDKIILEAYEFLLKKNNLDKSQLVEFKELITELVIHANEYNEINGKFFGRDSLMIKIKEYLLSNSNFPFIGKYIQLKSDSFETQMNSLSFSF